VRSIEQFLTRFRSLIDGLVEQHVRVYVLVDDLDRCLPEEALEIFEAVKLFLDAPGCGFVVAVDRQVIRKGLRLRYPATATEELVVDPDAYLEKTISVSFDLPRLLPADMDRFIEDAELSLKLTEEERCLVHAALGTNPRRFKRFLNLLSLQTDIARLTAERANGRMTPFLVETADPAARAIYLKLLLISYRFSGVFDQMLRDPALAARLQQYANRYAGDATGDEPAARTARNEKLGSESAAVKALAWDEDFWAFIARSPDLASGAVIDRVFASLRASYAPPPASR
jgi:hypothetical protein